MSKSVLNILEAATSLFSLMAKPAHILFVIGALSEFMSNSLALVTEKGCRVLCKSQTNVSGIFGVIFSKNENLMFMKVTYLTENFLTLKF